ncbi:hypothetical protein CVT24_010955 [Panaeolus cyanescens]|uniref:Uncharacterized protein n=1 Tax=Panaeolus cyanescens TaxID=181874 RepID=A0A409YVW5_9AGAR|nr:hypothetical protein CVT24_010955 [Panaeolus cyanescens]
MSRGDRVAVSGILSTSMRDNYGEYGVEEQYYKKVGSTYRNPHYPGIRLCLFSWLNKWWKMEHDRVKAFSEDDMMLLDMAAADLGSGEATLAFIEWCTLGKRRHQQQKEQAEINGLPLPKKKQVIIPDLIDDEFPRPQIMAADPFTSTAYTERTSFPCANLSFDDFAEGLLPTTRVDVSTGEAKALDVPEDSPIVIEMVVCSFAMHLVENPSSLFTLLWELSLKSRWLIILAPHKKPEIKDGWGWSKWDTEAWAESPMAQSKGEFIHERVHCRVYRSLNV